MVRSISVTFALLVAFGCVDGGESVVDATTAADARSTGDAAAPDASSLRFDGGGADASSADAAIFDASVMDDSAVPGADAAPGGDAVPGGDAGPVSGLDILFVVDNSGSMAEEQDKLVAAFDGFITELATRAGGTLPSLHIGVVSTDLGTPYSISGCSGSGDDGVLQDTPRGACSGPSDRYIVDEPAAGGGRTVNYGGTLDDVFGCIAPLGTNGCGFEQPLEAMRRALGGGVPENAGFLRADAALMVVIVSDEDDCSASDPAMYDPSGEVTFGPLASFRCFEFGVRCDPDEPRVLGTKTSCVSREDSAYMYSVQSYVDFLHGLKPSGRVVVVGLVGAAAPVAVESSETGGPRLVEVCGSADGAASPAVRHHMLLQSFPARATTGSICDASLAAPLQAAAAIAAALMP